MEWQQIFEMEYHSTGLQGEQACAIVYSKYQHLFDEYDLLPTWLAFYTSKCARQQATESPTDEETWGKGGAGGDSQPTRMLSTRRGLR